MFLTVVSSTSARVVPVSMMAYLVVSLRAVSQTLKHEELTVPPLVLYVWLPTMYPELATCQNPFELSTAAYEIELPVAVTVAWSMKPKV